MGHMTWRGDCSACGGRYVLAVFGDTLTPTPTPMVGVGIRVSPNIATAYMPLHALHATVKDKHSAMTACLANLLYKSATVHHTL